MRILLVGGDEMSLDGLSSWLTSRGHEVQIDMFGKETLRLLREQEFDFLIIHEYKMFPQFWGVCKQLMQGAKEINPDIITIAICVYAQENKPDHVDYALAMMDLPKALEAPLSA